jgi:uncharacterized protein (UPF0276 family)
MTSLQKPSLPQKSFGLGLRKPHYDYILAERPKLDFFEIISENFIDYHLGYLAFLADLRKDYQIIMHGVSMNIGGFETINKDYLTKIKRLADFLEAPHISDHICFTGFQNANSHDLLPVPYTEEALSHIVQKIKDTQDFLGRQMVFENPSSYVQFNGETMLEYEFIAELVKQSQCALLLDVNNIYVSSFNHGYDAKKYIDAIDGTAIKQIHLAGHKNKGDIIIDTHDNFVIDEVWDLYKYIVQKFGAKPTMVEWDENIPEFEIVYGELEKARAVIPVLDAEIQ